MAPAGIARSLVAAALALGASGAEVPPQACDPSAAKQPPSCAAVGGPGVLLLQKRSAVSTGLGDAQDTWSAGPAACHTAVKGEGCFNHVTWAMQQGIRTNPEWYPGVTAQSSFEAFQAVLHRGGHGGCPQPCEKEACRTAQPGEECYAAATAARATGIVQSPELYPGLTRDSSLDDFQAFLSEKGRSGCPQPCRPYGTTSLQPGPVTKPLDSSAGPAGRPQMAECAGDCDKDSDCLPGLKCFQRDALQSVPGCSGEGIANYDYCYDPRNVVPAPTASPPTTPATTAAATTAATTTAATTTTAESTSKSVTAATTTAAAPGSTAAPITNVDVNLRVMTFNVYYAALGSPERVEGISSAIASMQADIAVITEQWKEKTAILQAVRQKSGRNYEFCNSGPQETTWDGDILFDADLWQRISDGIYDWGYNRGLSWAVLAHRATGRRVLVFGAHPICCGNENIHLQNALDFAARLKAMAEYPDTPVILMGDFNALEDWPSVKLYKGETVSAYNRQWKLPLAFRDAFREANNQQADGTTHNSGARLDYIFLESRSPAVFRTKWSSIWRSAPGKSDHYPLLADVVLLKKP